MLGGGEVAEGGGFLNKYTTYTCGIGSSIFSMFQFISSLLCTLPSRRPGIAKGNERTRLGRVHLFFFFAFVLIIVL